MEPVLTPAIIRRLREGQGVDVLDHLDLSNGLLVPREVEIVANCITEHFTLQNVLSPLQTIDFSGNLICGLDEHNDGEYDCGGFEKFINALLVYPDKRPLRKLILYRNNIGREGCTALSRLISPDMPVFLHELCLRSCSIDVVGLKNLLVNMENCKILHYLDLRQNEFGREGAEMLGDCLFKNKFLRRLDLSHNSIGSLGVAALTEKIVQNVTLQILSLVDCSIGDDGARAVGSFLKANTGVSHLDLQENGITDVGADDLAKGLFKNRTLVMLGLQHNDFGNMGASMLGRALRNNNVLKTLFMLGNSKLTDAGVNECVQQMQWTEDKQLMLDLPFVFPQPPTSLSSPSA